MLVAIYLNHKEYANRNYQGVPREGERILLGTDVFIIKHTVWRDPDIRDRYTADIYVVEDNQCKLTN